jgi:hypothetical protein
VTGPGVVTLDGGLTLLDKLFHSSVPIFLGPARI